MAANRSSAEYGIPYVDQESVSNPETQAAANKFNRMGEDVAQMTRTSVKVDVLFSTTATAAVVAVTPTSGKTQWGTGSSYLPTISKTATGTYVITWATSYVDALDGTTADAVSETETLALTRARADIQANSTGYARGTASGNVATVYVRDSTDNLSDLSGGVAIWVEAK
jgi:hypothetical protein